MVSRKLLSAPQSFHPLSRSPARLGGRISLRLSRFFPGKRKPVSAAHTMNLEKQPKSHGTPPLAYSLLPKTSIWNETVQRAQLRETLMKHALAFEVPIPPSARSGMPIVAKLHRSNPGTANTVPALSPDELLKIVLDARGFDSANPRRREAH